MASIPNKKAKAVVVGEYSEWGYEVQAIRGSRILHSYAAGNHKQDSQQRAALGSPEACSLRQIRRNCIRTSQRHCPGAPGTIRRRNTPN